LLEGITGGIVMDKPKEDVASASPCKLIALAGEVVLRLDLEWVLQCNGEIAEDVRLNRKVDHGVIPHSWLAIAPSRKGLNLAVRVERRGACKGNVERAGLVVVEIANSQLPRIACEGAMPKVLVKPALRGSAKFDEEGLEGSVVGLL